MSSDDGKIKSALDIALEKAQKLGSLSAEEKQRARDEELVTAADALARRYLNGLPLSDIEEELAKHNEKERQIISRYLLSHFLDEIDLEHTERAENMLAAIEHIHGDSAVAQSIRDLLQEYQTATDKAWQENYDSLATARIDELKLKGISGSAIEPAIEASPAWLEIIHRLDSHYQERLAKIRLKYKNL